jgi:hypothetical protein
MGVLEAVVGHGAGVVEAHLGLGVNDGSFGTGMPLILLAMGPWS